jgi:hypothetical protein
MKDNSSGDVQKIYEKYLTKEPEKHMKNPSS